MKKSSKITLTVLLILAMCFNVLSPVFATTPQNATDTVDAIQQDVAEPQSSEDEVLPEVLPADEKKDVAEEIQNTEDTALREAVLEDASMQAENVAEDTLMIKTMPSESVFDKLWIGDSVGIKGTSTIEGVKVNTEFQVIKGDGVKVFDEWNQKFYSNLKGLLFTKAEDAVVKVLFKNKDTQALMGEKVYNFKITERTKAVERIPDTKSYLIGERFSNSKSSYAFKNMNYSGFEIVEFDGAPEYSRLLLSNAYTTVDAVFATEYDHAFYFHGYGDPYIGSLIVEEDRTGKPYYCSRLRGFFKAGDFNYDTTYVQPITGAKTAAPYTIKVEEPIIKDNAPQNIKIGSSINLNTELTNLVAKNQKVVDIKEYGTGSEVIAFIPKVEIIEGQTLVTQSEQDYSNTLTSSEKLTFNKTGTVKLKIKYNEMATCDWCMLKDGTDPPVGDVKDVDHRYNPEKIITINVVDKGVKAISMEKLPTKTEYVEATAFDPAGGKIKVDYDNETTETLDLSKANCTVDTSKPGESVPVTVEYGGVTTTFNIKVTPKSLEKIAVTKDPQTQYLAGDALNLNGGELTLTYNNGTTQALALTDKDVVVTGYDKDKVGQQTLTITYKEKTAPLKVEVISREALNKVIEMINKIDLDNLYESDRAMVYDAKNAYNKLGTDIEKAAVTNVEILNKAVALFEASFYSEAVANNTTITAKGDSNIFALRTRLVAKGSTLSTEHQQGVLKTLNNNPQLIDAYDFSYAYVEKDGKDQLAVLAKEKTLQYTLPLDTNIVGKKAVNVVYINAKGEPTVLKSDYQNGVLSFESGQVGTFALILTDLPAPVDPTNPNGGSTNASTNGNNPITGLFNNDNAVQSVVVVLCVVLLACTSAFISKKKQQ